MLKEILKWFSEIVPCPDLPVPGSSWTRLDFFISHRTDWWLVQSRELQFPPELSSRRGHDQVLSPLIMPRQSCPGWGLHPVQVQGAPPCQVQVPVWTSLTPPVQESDVTRPDTKADSELVSRSTRLAAGRERAWVVCEGGQFIMIKKPASQLHKNSSSYRIILTQRVAQSKGLSPGVRRVYVTVAGVWPGCPASGTFWWKAWSYHLWLGFALPPWSSLFPLKLSRPVNQSLWRVAPSQWWCLVLRIYSKLKS